jgi:hypothetical protein
MITALMNLFFGCRHRTMSRPITPVQKTGFKPSTTYVTCLNCGQQFEYDVTIMRIGKAIPRSPVNGSGDFQSSY